MIGISYLGMCLNTQLDPIKCYLFPLSITSIHMTNTPAEYVTTNPYPHQWFILWRSKPISSLSTLQQRGHVLCSKFQIML